MGSIFGDTNGARCRNGRLIVDCHHVHGGRNRQAGAVHPAIAGAAAVANAGQGNHAVPGSGRLAAIAVGHCVDHGLGACSADATAAQGNSGGATHQADAIADAVDRSNPASTIDQCYVSAIDAEDFAGAVGQAADGEGQAGDVLASLHRADADAAEQVDGATVLGMGRAAAGSGGGRRVVDRDYVDDGTARSGSAQLISEGPVQRDTGDRVAGRVGISQLLQDVVHIRRGRDLAVGIGEGQGQLAARANVEAGDHLAVLDQAAAGKGDAIAIEEAEQITGIGAAMAHHDQRGAVVVAVAAVEQVQVGIRHHDIGIDHDRRATFGVAAAAVDVTQHRSCVGLHGTNIDSTAGCPHIANRVDGQDLGGIAVLVQVIGVGRQSCIAATIEQRTARQGLVGQHRAAIVGQVAQQQAGGALVVQHAAGSGDADVATEVTVSGCLDGQGYVVRDTACGQRRTAGCRGGTGTGSVADDHGVDQRVHTICVDTATAVGRSVTDHRGVVDEGRTGGDTDTTAERAGAKHGVTAEGAVDDGQSVGTAKLQAAAMGAGTGGGVSGDGAVEHRQRAAAPHDANTSAEGAAGIAADGAVDQGHRHTTAKQAATTATDVGVVADHRIANGQATANTGEQSATATAGEALGKRQATDLDSCDTRAHSHYAAGAVAGERHIGDAVVVQVAIQVQVAVVDVELVATQDDGAALVTGQRAIQVEGDGVATARPEERLANAQAIAVGQVGSVAGAPGLVGTGIEVGRDHQGGVVDGDRHRVTVAVACGIGGLDTHTEAARRCRGVDQPFQCSVDLCCRAADSDVAGTVVADDRAAAGGGTEGAAGHRDHRGQVAALGHGQGIAIAAAEDDRGHGVGDLHTWHCVHWRQGVDGVVVGIGGTGTRVACRVGVAGVVQGNKEAGVLDVAVGRQGGGPGEAAIHRVQVAEAAIGDSEIGQV